jgi:hypothetical protein
LSKKPLLILLGAKPETESPKDGESENVGMEVDAEQAKEIKIEELSPVQKAQQGIIEKLSQVNSFHAAKYFFND